MLKRSEQARVKALMGRMQAGLLGPAEELELRALIAHEYPAEAQSYNLHRLSQLAYGMMAVWMVFPESGATA